MPRRVPYPDLPKGKGSGARLQRQWLSLLWSIESAAENGTHGLKGLTVALGRIIVARELEDFVLNAEEHQKPLRTVDELLWDKRLPLNAAGQSMQGLVRKLPPRTLSVEMGETAVFPSAWDRWRFFRALGGLGEGGPWGPWAQEPDNHHAVAWKPWPIVWVNNGNHSTMAALVLGGGKLKCKEAFDFTPVLEAVRTDGITWNRADDGSELGPVRSLPMAGIFVIGQCLAGIAGALLPASAEC